VLQQLLEKRRSRHNGSMLNVSDATVGTPFDTHQIQSLPFEGNNVLDLLSLQPACSFSVTRRSPDEHDSRSGAVDAHAPIRLTSRSMV